MVTFFGSGLAQGRTGFRRACGQGLAVIKPLGRDFPGVVHSHERCGMAAQARVDRRGGRISRGRAAGGRACKAGAEAVVGEFQQPVEGGEDAWVHAPHII